MRWQGMGERRNIRTHSLPGLRRIGRLHDQPIPRSRTDARPRTEGIAGIFEGGAVSADVREKHGAMLNNGDKSFTLNEAHNCIALVANDGLGSRCVFVTPNEARHIASKLHRLARRIDERILAE